MTDDDKIFPYSFFKEAYEEYRRESPPLKDFTKGSKTGLRLINPSDDWSDDIPDLEWTVHELIPKRQVCLFSGHGAAGKSTIALHLAAAHALGESFLNFSPEPGPALVFDAEDEILVMRHRLNAILKNYGKTLKDLNDRLCIISRAGEDAVLGQNNHGIINPTQLYLELEQIIAKLKPRQIVIASSANVFAGNELDRTQVTQFISILTRLAIAADGSVILISHPSLTGMSSGSGISGSTSWHNSVRAQMYLEGLKNEGEEEVQGLRKLSFKKNQYGPTAAGITLKWQNGMFLPEQGQTDYEKAASEAKADNLFLDLLKQSRDAGRHVSDKLRANNYAPAVFALEDEAKLAKVGKIDLAAAMRRLFTALKIRISPYGPKSDGTEEIVPL